MPLNLFSSEKQKTPSHYNGRGFNIYCGFPIWEERSSTFSVISIIEYVQLLCLIYEKSRQFLVKFYAISVITQLVLVRIPKLRGSYLRLGCVVPRPPLARCMAGRESP